MKKIMIQISHQIRPVGRFVMLLAFVLISCDSFSQKAFFYFNIASNRDKILRIEDKVQYFIQSKPYTDHAAYVSNDRYPIIELEFNSINQLKLTEILPSSPDFYYELEQINSVFSTKKYFPNINTSPRSTDDEYDLYFFIDYQDVKLIKGILDTNRLDLFDTEHKINIFWVLSNEDLNENKEIDPYAKAQKYEIEKF